MTLYRWNSDLMKLVDKKTGELMAIADDNAICAPHVWSDIGDYMSPVTDHSGIHKPVGGRAAQREDLKRNGCYLMDPPKDKASNSTRGFRDADKAAANGCRASEEAQEMGQKRDKLHAQHLPVK